MSRANITRCDACGESIDKDLPYLDGAWTRITIENGLRSERRIDACSPTCIAKVARQIAVEYDPEVSDPAALPKIEPSASPKAEPRSTLHLTSWTTGDEGGRVLTFLLLAAGLLVLLWLLLGRMDTTPPPPPKKTELGRAHESWGRGS